MSLVPTVLLVEDSLDDSYFFERAIRKGAIQCNFRHVLDGGAAIIALEEAKTNPRALPNFMFLDLKMPIKNGFEVLEWMQRQSFSKSLVVVVLSGSNQEADMVKARQLGAVGYLVKPISPSDLIRWLHHTDEEIQRASRSDQ